MSTKKKTELVLVNGCSWSSINAGLVVLWTEYWRLREVAPDSAETLRRVIVKATMTLKG